MPDLLDPSPADTAAPVAPETPAESTPGGSSPPPAAKSRSQIDYEARLEEVLAADRSAKETLKQAQTLQHKYGAIDKYIETGDTSHLKQALGSKWTSDLLVDISADLSPATKTPEEIFEEKWAAKQAEEQKVKDEAANKAKQANLEVFQIQFNDFMGRSKTFLKENLDTFEFLPGYGVDAADYQERALVYAETHNKLPEPKEILQQIDDEHRAKFSKTKHGRAKLSPREALSLEEHVAQTYQKNKPAGSTPAQNAKPKSPTQVAREALQAHDREQRERLQYRK